jgi:ABC-type Fe3+-hydroxamate transport system substrate-binding protein
MFMSDTRWQQPIHTTAPVVLTVHYPTRRRFLITAGGALLLTAAGCAGGDGAVTGVQTVATREVIDLYGRTINIPTDPQRIVTIDFSGVTVLLTAMDFNVIGATDFASNPTTLPPEFVNGKTFESIGDLQAVNFERVARLKPDLIVASTYTREEFAPGEAIAPVIGIADDVVDRLPAGPFGLLRYLGDVLDRRDRAAAIEAEAVALLESFDLLRGRRTAVLTSGNDFSGNVYLGIGGPSGQLLDLLGIVPTPKEVDGYLLAGPGSDVLVLSIERVPEVLADAEVIVHLTYGLVGQDPEPLKSFERFRTSPIWQRVPAVARGNVAYVENECANFGWGVRGIEVLLAQFREQLGG